MIEPTKEIRGTRRTTDGSIEDVVVVIFKPAIHPEQGCWACRIDWQGLIDAKSPIAGVDARQALELAEMVVDSVFDHHGIQRRTEE